MGHKPQNIPGELRGGKSRERRQEGAGHGKGDGRETREIPTGKDWGTAWGRESVTHGCHTVTQ